MKIKYCPTCNLKNPPYRRVGKIAICDLCQNEVVDMEDSRSGKIKAALLFNKAA